MSMKHTKGEWKTTKVTNGWDISCGIFTIAQVFEEFGPKPKEAKANAHLIAAAPKLLEACKRDAELANVAILLTPTGEHRNKLTEINILRLQAITEAEKT